MTRKNKTLFRCDEILKKTSFFNLKIGQPLAVIAVRVNHFEFFGAFPIKLS